MNDRCGCVRAHGYDLTGKMTGGRPKIRLGPSAITLVESSVIALAQATECNPPPVIVPVKSYPCARWRPALPARSILSFELCACVHAVNTAASSVECAAPSEALSSKAPRRLSSAIAWLGGLRAARRVADSRAE